MTLFALLLYGNALILSHLVLLLVLVALVGCLTFLVFVHFRLGFSIRFLCQHSREILHLDVDLDLPLGRFLMCLKSRSVPVVKLRCANLFFQID